MTGGTLTRHMYLGDRLIADSPVAAPSGLTLASISPEERSILLARAMRDTLRWSPQLYPGYVLTAEEAAKLGALLAFILVVLGATPGRVRVGLAGQRRSPFRRLRRGHVILVVTIFGLSLTPLTCVRSAHAGGSGGPPPPGTVFPVYFIHGDHLGSTVMLTCYKQGSCADRAVIRYFRYDAYGQMKAYDVNGAVVARGNELTERLYTGQRWDWQAQVYYYGARLYDPKVANFLSEDSVRQYANPYAYVGWNPVGFADPTGTFSLNALDLYGSVGLAGAYLARGGSAQEGGIAASAMAAQAGVGLAAGGSGSGIGNGIAAIISAAIAAVGGNRLAAAQAAAEAMFGALFATLRGDSSDYGMTYSTQATVGAYTVESRLAGGSGNFVRFGMRLNGLGVKRPV